MTGLLNRNVGIALLLALFIAAGAFAFKFYIETPERPTRVMPVLGVPGSDHAHASMLIFIGTRSVNFCDPKFMLKHALVHFEDDNCTIIHKHATGVTLPTFLKTLGVALSGSCIVLSDGVKHCNEGANVLRVVYNAEEVPIGELVYHELRNNDHILINYGPEEGATLRFKYNQVPHIPDDINEPVE